MWQELYAQLKEQNFTIIAVAFDSRDGAAKPWVDEAEPDYPTLIDPFHHVADLYNMVNVNLAVWIDEQGRIVRPVESAGATEGFRKINRDTGAMPESVTSHATTVKNRYHEALRDWVAKGQDSEFAFDASTARGHLSLPSETTQKAHASFVLGQYLIAKGDARQGDQLVAAASDLHPESWAIWRQGAALDHRGLAATADFWKRVDALGPKKYYGDINMSGMPG